MAATAAEAAADAYYRPRWVFIPFPHPSSMPPPPPPHQQFAEPFVPLHHRTPPPPQAQRSTPSPTASPSAAATENGAGGGDENRTIWVGDLHYWMDENYLHSCFGATGEVVSIKVIRNRQTGQSEGYGFVEFCSRAAAEKVLQSFNSQLMPNSDQVFRLNWASHSVGDKRSEVTHDHSIFVGDLASDVTDETLLELFSSRYRSIKGAKVIIDANTGRSRGYGFVRFGDGNDRIHAMSEMNGVYCSTRPIRVGPATPRKVAGDSGSCSPGQSDNDSTNTTIYVGGLDPNVGEDELRKAFLQFGDIVYVRIPAGRQCGFVQFVDRRNAEQALQGLNGSVIGKQAVRVSWGRSPGNKQSRNDAGSRRNNNIHYRLPVYSGYCYTAPVPLCNLYATTAAYGVYPFYGNQQLVS